MADMYTPKPAWTGRFFQFYKYIYTIDINWVIRMHLPFYQPYIRSDSTLGILLAGTAYNILIKPNLYDTKNVGGPLLFSLLGTRALV